MSSFHLPVRPYSPIDALNRRAAAVGSPRYAAAASNADYNGHHVTISWNAYRGYYIAEYWWAGRNVLARGSFAICLKAALSEYQRGALGASVSISLREVDFEAEALCRNTPELQPGELPRTLEWCTWKHECAAASVRDYANPGMRVMHFDWPLMEASDTQEAYEAALKAKYGSVYT